MRRFVPFFLVSIYHRALAFAAAIRYGFPSKKIVVIGVTGTNGKSTVVDLTHQIFARAGFRVASASSLRFIIDSKEQKNELKMTMPGRFFIQKFLRDAVEAHCDVVILEVTSEGIRQSRHKHIQFDVAALTNVTPEHLESHGSFENYRREKIKLFKAIGSSKKRGKAIIINGDDPSAKLFLKYQRSHTWVYGLKPEAWEKFGHVIVPQSYMTRIDGVKFILGGIDFSMKLLGKFNVYNALCAYAIATSRGISPEIIREALESVEGVPGRLEFVTRPPQTAFSVVVDYAHTPDALLNVYETLKQKNKKLICVLGSAGGGRDKWKRPEMGSIADTYCDEIFLTNEDPYDEDPMHIIHSVAQGIMNKKPTIILDRKEAIAAAIERAAPDDTVIITGKGAEPLMALADGERVSWDDRDIVRSTLRKK